jgi:hypothetical protein
MQWPRRNAKIAKNQVFLCSLRSFAAKIMRQAGRCSCSKLNKSFLQEAAEGDHWRDMSVIALAAPDVPAQRDPTPCKSSAIVLQLKSSGR